LTPCYSQSNNGAVDEEAKRLGTRVQQARLKREMTQEALAAKVGISRAYLARVEIGRHEPTLTTLRRIAKALNVKLGNLVE
jgi:transcriptional regulator with XRE-family HTH domain